MYKKLLDRFLGENAVKDKKTPSAATLANFQIRLLLAPEVNEKIQNFITETVYQEQTEREKEVLAERSTIELATTGDQIIRLMRGRIDLINQPILVHQAMKFEEAVVPEVIRMLKTSLNTGFIETAIRILSVCSQCIAEELIGCFDDVRDPYAQCMILVVLGFKANETYIPWLIEKHLEMKKRYPDETYCDGAYYALVEINERFYSDPKEGS